MDYILGVSDADGLAKVQLATVGGAVVQTFTVGSLSLLYAEQEEACHNLAEIFVTAQLAGYPVRNCRQVCLGIAGLSGKELPGGPEQKLRSVMTRCGFTGDALLISDDQTALAGALGASKGAILIAGDSSVCFGQNALGSQRRTGGLGRLADDDGSAYAIGREILRTVGRASDGRSGMTHLTALVYRAFGLMSAADLARFLRSGTPTIPQICELSAGLPVACQQRDKVALAIVDKTVDQLLALVQPVIARLSLEKGALAVAGRVLLNDAFVGVSFKKRLHELFPNLQCVPPRNDSVSGAVMLAKQRLGLRHFSRSNA